MGDPPPHRAREEEDEDDVMERWREKRREKLLNAAKALIESGTDPDVVARMMLQMPGKIGKRNLKINPLALLS